jgi:hypothetical protein
MKPTDLTITRSGAGWLVTCGCGFERYCGGRSAADRVAYDHRQTHGKRER